MIVIDEFADTKLIETLEKMRDQSDLFRCVHFRLASKPKIAGIKEKIIAAADAHIPPAEVEIQMYLCEDGDIFILAPNLPAKNAKALMLEVAAHADLPVTDDFILFCETDAQMAKLLVFVDSKVQARRRVVEEEAQARESAREKAEVARKRQSILMAPNVAAHDIAERRAAHKAPEIMIVEDDTFSLRLVANVLQKQFALTMLESAENALSTYVNLAPDVLFLDINLPDVTGHELLEKIIALDPKAYVVMLSGNSDKDNIMQAMSKGAKGFVAKPFTREKLMQYIDRCPTIAKK